MYVIYISGCTTAICRKLNYNSTWPTQDLGHEDSDEEQPCLLGGGVSGSSSNKKRLPLCSMDVLSSWYRESFETMSRHVRAYSPAGTQGRTGHSSIIFVTLLFYSPALRSQCYNNYIMIAIYNNLLREHAVGTVKVILIISLIVALIKFA